MLGADKKLWLFGMAHLSDLETSDGPSDDDFVQVIEAAQRESGFPSGPVAYIPNGFTQEVEPDFRMVSLRPPGALNLEMKLGLGIAGFVVVGLARDDLFEDGVTRPGGVLLSDFESVIADTYALTAATAEATAYTGPVDVAFTILRGENLPPCTLYSLDHETGEFVVENSELRRFEPLTASYVITEPVSAAGSAHMSESMNKVASRLARRFNQSRPQLLPDA